MSAQVHGRRDSDIGDSLSAPTRTLLFGPLGFTDVPSAVVRRLRAAIGLGLLPDGKRLPKESDLATQMRITNFALREALAELRHQGLLVTRPGKYGGSFVTHPSDSDDLEREELVVLSSAELRDLGDWRQMLASHAAALAAQRASEPSSARLADSVERVRSASSGHQARRAHGRFHLELASAAQSMRMTRAEFVVHEQIDWLFGLVLQTAEEREESADVLRDLAEAVGQHDSSRARAAAEWHVTLLIDRLARLRLELIAAQKPDLVRPDPRSLRDEIELIITNIAVNLAALARDVAPALVSDDGLQSMQNRVSLASLQQFDSFLPFVKGIGIAAEVGVVPGHPYWIQYWRRTDAGPVPDNHHVVDPDREDFYDYEQMEFVARSRETHQPWAYGPYVDYGGVDDYIITVDAPVLDGGRFYGVSMADVLVADLEKWLAPWLAAGGESSLLNAENRVIVSNSVRHRVGDVVVLPHGCHRDAFPVFGWSLLTTS